MSPTSVACSVLHAPQDLRAESRVLEPLGPQELEIAIQRTGLCGSDLHYYKHFANGDFHVREPLTLGPESSGIVTAIGDDVDRSRISIGDKVALEVGVPCDYCDLCTSGRYNLCPALRFRSSAKSFPHFQGTLQERINHPAKWCHKLPEGISLDQAALLEPLAVALHAIKRVGLSQKSRTLVLGAGAVGLLVAKSLLCHGHEVVIADIDKGRTDFAVENGFATRACVLAAKREHETSAKLAAARENAKALCAVVAQNEKADCVEFDAVFECTGVESCVQTSIYASRPGGKIALVGMGQPIQTLQLSAAALREVDILGVFRYAGMYKVGIDLLQSGRLDGIEKIITHRFRGFEEVPAAFETAGTPVDKAERLVLKVVIETGTAA